MGAGIWLASVLAVVVSNDPAAVSHMGRGDQEKLGLAAMEVMDDEAFGHEVRGTNLGLDQLIGLTLLNQGARAATAPTVTVATPTDVNGVAGLPASATESPRIAQYTFVIHWLVIATGTDASSRLDRGAKP